MKLTPLAFSNEQCLREAQEFKAFLGAHTTLKERDEILPFFKARHHLSAFLGAYNGLVIHYDRFAHEFDIFGSFACDLVAGDWAKRAYVFVEFEDAAPNSIFVQTRRKTLEWSPRFEHGFSQILDWFYKMDIERHTPQFEQEFGTRDPHVSGLLVVGRRQDIGIQERDRLDWRHRHLTVHGKQIHSMTYDDLCEDTLERLATFSALKSVLAADTGTGAEAAGVAKAPAPLPPAPSVPGTSS
jgi:hypothetical protein